MTDPEDLIDRLENLIDQEPGRKRDTRETKGRETPRMFGEASQIVKDLNAVLTWNDVREDQLELLAVHRKGRNHGKHRERHGKQRDDGKHRGERHGA